MRYTATYIIEPRHVLLMNLGDSGLLGSCITTQPLLWHCDEGDRTKFLGTDYEEAVKIFFVADIWAKCCTERLTAGRLLELGLNEATIEAFERYWTLRSFHGHDDRVEDIIDELCKNGRGNDLLVSDSILLQYLAHAAKDHFGKSATYSPAVVNGGVYILAEQAIASIIISPKSELVAKLEAMRLVDCPISIEPIFWTFASSRHPAWNRRQFEDGIKVLFLTNLISKFIPQYLEEQILVELGISLANSEYFDAWWSLEIFHGYDKKLSDVINQLCNSGMAIELLESSSERVRSAVRFSLNRVRTLPLDK